MRVFCGRVDTNYMKIAADRRVTSDKLLVTNIFKYFALILFNQKVHL